MLDQWVVRTWRPTETRGEMIIVRYADDFVLGFQYRDDAERFLAALRARFAQFGLELHPDKTRLLEFGRYAAANRKKRGQGRPETFDFLGFTHYCRRTRKGGFGLGRKPIAKRVRRTLQAVGGKLRKRMHADKVATGKWLGQVLNGWLNYYAVPTSYRSLDQFTRDEAALAANPPQEIATRPPQLGRLGGTVRQTMARDEDQTPMAGSEIRR